MVILIEWFSLCRNQILLPAELQSNLSVVMLHMLCGDNNGGHKRGHVCLKEMTDFF